MENEEDKRDEVIKETTTHQEKSWTIRPYLAGDEKAVVALFERVFGRSISEAHWQWKLKTVPSPVENVWLAVNDSDERPIFHYAGIPCRYQLPSGEVTAMVSVDTMTDPEFRRRGLLTAVGQHVYEQWQAAGVPFVLGLPNEKWGSRTTALGWETLFPLQWLFRPLQPQVNLARRVKIPPLSGLTPLGSLWNAFWNGKIATDPNVAIRPVEHAGPEFDSLWQKHLSKVPVSVIRDKAWVNWRYLDTPTFDYQVLLAERNSETLGYLAYRLQENGPATVGFIAELSAAPGDDMVSNTLIKHTINLMQAANVQDIFVLAIPGTPLHNTFRQAGFIFSKPSFVVQLVPLNPNLPLDTLRNPQNWHMAGGDFDVI